MIETVVEQQAPAMERLRAALAAETAAQAARAQAILDLALEGDWADGDEFEMIGNRPIRIGGEGTPLVDEALPLEIAAIMATSVTSATLLIRDVVSLHSRHPATWAAVQDGRVPVWRARQLAQLADTFELGYGDCLRIDALIEPCLGRLGWGRTIARYRAGIIQVAPAKVAAHTERARRSRHVRTGVSEDDPTLGWMSALADTSDIQAVDHLLGLVTQSLIDLGDTDPIDVVRAKALGRLADPEGVLALLDGVDDSTPAGQHTERRSRRRHAPTAQVYVHLGPDALENGGPARIEKLGPVLVDELSHVLGHHRIKLTPVVHVHDAERPVDAYDIPELMRASVLARDRYEVFLAKPADATSTTPTPTLTANSNRPGLPTSARSPDDPTAARPTAAGSWNNPARASSGGPHPAARPTASDPTAPATSPPTTPPTTPPPSNASCSGNSTAEWPQ